MRSAISSFVTQRSAVCAFVGVVAAAVWIAARPTPAPLASVAAGRAYTARLTPGANKRPLSAADRKLLSAWAVRLVGCAARRGLHLSEPRLRHDELVIERAESSLSLAATAEALQPCSSKHPPPKGTSFVLQRDGFIHLYKPRACLLPIHRA